MAPESENRNIEELKEYQNISQVGNLVRIRWVCPKVLTNTEVILKLLYIMSD